MGSAANTLLLKATVILVVFCFVESAADSRSQKGSCLKYGHSCWGGHGKRNGGGSTSGGGGNIARMRDEIVPSSGVNTRWYLSRLVQAPPDLRLWRDERKTHQLPTRNSQNRQIQNESDVDTDFSKRLEETEDVPSDSAQDDSDTEEVVLMEEPSSLGQKLRLYKLMKKNAEKLN